MRLLGASQGPKTFRRAIARDVPPCFGRICIECLAFYRLCGDPTAAFLWGDQDRKKERQ